MSSRFYSAALIIADRVTLDGPEAHHLLQVMRARVGAEITLFDGSGAEFMGVLDKVLRNGAELRIVERRDVDRELSEPLVVGVALPKGDRQKWLVEKLTELGVSALVPLLTNRGVAQPTSSAAERLKRSVIEACKQCGRNRLMTIGEPVAWDDWIRTDLGTEQHATSATTALFAKTAADWRRVIAHPGGLPLSNTLLRRQPTALSIGPEGGYTEEEIAGAIEAGWQSVSLGPRILRVETAAIAMAAAFALRSLE